ncbi:uncharacterized protein LOC124111296 isoform X2 [Haliotis rufescens]|nr:uncharacterized protein LOC124111296 isoform X2 [Haliotis rufescens]XP_046326923.2 uncharacterized protein LOC124111296 isoform X2 [Haliotis rufescens]
MSLQVLQDEESHQVTVLEDAEGDVEGEGAEAAVAASHNHAVTYKFRDKNSKMVAAWQEHFQDHKTRIEISHGDIFKDAPSADALVSPANSFGFMDGGIDMVYSLHFGWQMQKRLQEIIRTEKHGELLVGDAIILPTFEGGAKEDSMDWSKTNEGQSIKWLVSVPTMRVPMNVEGTVNAYLAFKAVILAVQRHNEDASQEKISSVLIPGLGTAVGQMPVSVCAFQMLQAYETFELDMNTSLISPEELYDISKHHQMMSNPLYFNS